MSQQTKYCIIYANLCPETSERLSVGLLAFKDNESTYFYSERKLEALKSLYPEKVYTFYRGLIEHLNTEQLTSASSLDYLHRYSNNLLTISQVSDVNMEYSPETAHWLYENYVEPTV